MISRPPGLLNDLNYLHQRGDIYLKKIDLQCKHPAGTRRFVTEEENIWFFWKINVECVWKADNQNSVDLEFNIVRKMFQAV